MNTRPLLLAAALAAAPLSVVAPAPAGAAGPTAQAAAVQTVIAERSAGQRPPTRVAGAQLAAGKLGEVRVVASNATLPRTGRGRPYRQAAFFVVLSALVGTACGVGRNLASRRRS